MPDETELTLTGDWRVTVTSRDAAWAQRVVASGTAAGTQTLSGNPGMTMDVYANGEAAWALSIEHNDGTHGWQASFVRARPRSVDHTSLGPSSLRTTRRLRAIGTSTTS